MLAAGVVVKVWIGGRYSRRLVDDGSLVILRIWLVGSCCIVVAIDLVTRNGVVSVSMLRSTLRAG